MTCARPNNEANQQQNVATQIEDGVYLGDLSDGAELEIETKNHHYKIVKSARTQARISGHPKICPEPVTVEIEGSSRSGLAGFKPGFIGRGMHLTFEHPTYHTVTTSRILRIHRVY
jgi:hypothetical protein